MGKIDKLSERTRMIHGDRAPVHLPHTPGPPVQRGSTVLLPTCDALYDGEHVTYGRNGLATQRTLRDALRQLENAEEVFLFPSGLAAITGTILALTSSGDEALVSDSVYNPTRKFLVGTMARFGVTVRFFDPAVDADTIANMINPSTRLIFLESPGSLTFEMQDVPAIARAARARGVMTAIDNTWSAGVLFKPLDHGVDVSIQSLTKYVCGHSDVFMGIAAARDAAVEMLAASSSEIGWAVSPDDAYMALRGLRTLHTRLAQHGAAALRVSNWLAERPEIDSVLCPALPDFPGHSIWQRDYSGICGLLGVILKPAPEAAVTSLIDGLELFGTGYSWGGFESLAIPCDPQLNVRSCTGRLPGPLLRLHIGLENVDDLIEDLEKGFRRSFSPNSRIRVAEET
jgi:cystathionine beta-lyase